MWIDTTTFPPLQTKSEKPLPSRRARRPGRRREGAGLGRSVCIGNSAFGVASLPPGAEGLCTFLRREKGLRFFFQFSVLSINKPPEPAAFGPARGGRREGLGRGEGFAQIRKKMQTLSTGLAPFQRVLSGSERTRSSWVVEDPTRHGAPSPA